MKRTATEFDWHEYHLRLLKSHTAAQEAAACEVSMLAFQKWGVKPPKVFIDHAHNRQRPAVLSRFKRAWRGRGQ